MSLRLSTEDEKAAFVMPAWVAGIQVCMDASGDVHVGLDSSPPCWNDGIGGLFFNRVKLIYSFFEGVHEEREVFKYFIVRDLRDLWGETFLGGHMPERMMKTAQGCSRPEPGTITRS